MDKRKILFARLGSFSHTNESLYAQLVGNFPDHEIVDFCVKKAVMKKPATVAAALLAEAMQHGPLILADRARRHEFFFKQAYTFRKISAMVRERFMSMAGEIDAVFQTQGLFNAALPGRPLVLYTDYSLKSPQFGSYTAHPSLVELETELYRRADALALSSSYLGKTMVEDYGCDPARITPIYIGANIKAPPLDGRIERYARQQICFVGIAWERKGGPALAEVFLKIADRFPKAELVIAGCTPAVSHPRIRVLGKISRNEVSRLYAESSIFCLPSLIEPSSVAAVEAAANGLPVVATQTGGFFDSVEDGVTGFLVPPQNPQALANALARLLDNPAEAQKMGAAGRQRTLQRFDWDVVGTKLADIIRRAARLS